MQIRDYELTDNIDALFEKRIIIYGAGTIGKRTARLLKEAGIDVDCFCDRNESLKEYMNHSVITLNQLEKMTLREDCMIIIGSMDYCEEMIEELDRRKINAYVCTWYGLQSGIEINVGKDERFPDFFREDFMKRKKMYESHVITMFLLNNYVNLCVSSIDFWVFQPEKTGSRTVEHTLKEAGLRVAHTHNIAQRTGVEAVDDLTTYFMDKIKFTGGKIIVVIRDPIARALSFFMEGFKTTFIISHLEEKCDLVENAKRFVMEKLNTNSEFVWFDEELQKVTGIDIYQYPFDKEKGYIWIKENNIEILVLKLEKLNENVAVLGEFVGKTNIQLSNSNTGEEKHYKHIYEELKKHIRFPARVLDEQYRENQQLDHFYTDDEKERFYQRWSRSD